MLMTANSPTTALAKAQDFLKVAREIDPYMGIQLVEALLVIAKRPGLTMQELSDETGLAQSSCSRNVAMLSKWHRLGKPGHNMVEAIEDPAERRRKIVFLTPKGIAHVTKMMSVLEPDFTFNPATSKEWLKRNR